MSTRDQSEVTVLLDAWRSGDEAAAAKLLPLVYDHLRALAGRIFDGQSAGQTLQPTALVHEAYLRIAAQPSPHWNDRKHFYRVAAMAMRQILTDAARRRRAAKRGGDSGRVSLSGAMVGLEAAGGIDVVELDDALERLKALDERQARIVELRFLAGFSVEEVADTLAVSPRTVELDWRLARAWLRRELGGEPLAPTGGVTGGPLTPDRGVKGGPAA